MPGGGSSGKPTCAADGASLWNCGMPGGGDGGQPVGADEKASSPGGGLMLPWAGAISPGGGASGASSKAAVAGAGGAAALAAATGGPHGNNSWRMALHASSAAARSVLHRLPAPDEPSHASTACCGGPKCSAMGSEPRLSGEAGAELSGGVLPAEVLRDFAEPSASSLVAHPGWMSLLCCMMQSEERNAGSIAIRSGFRSTARVGGKWGDQQPCAGSLGT